MTGAKSYKQRLIDFSLDPDGKNRWEFAGYSYITNPAFSENPNPFAVQNYYDSGGGCCHCCGHSPIVHHFFVSHPTKGFTHVGSECISKVLGMTKEKAIKTVMNREIRNYNNSLKIKKLYEQSEKFFGEHPEILPVISGTFSIRYERHWHYCPFQPREENFAKLHKDCSEFMAKAANYRDMPDGIKGAINGKGCLKCGASYVSWYEEKHRRLKAEPLKCEYCVVANFSELRPVQDCPDPTVCMVYSPAEHYVSGERIRKIIQLTYERNYKDIQFIFDDINFFNKSKQKTGYTTHQRLDLPVTAQVPIYNGEHPSIPIFDTRSLDKEPLLPDEETIRAEKVKSALAQLVRGGISK